MFSFNHPAVSKLISKEAIGFIQDGEVLVSVGSDRDRTMALWPAAREGCFRIGRKEGVPLATWRKGCVVVCMFMKRKMTL